MNSFSLSVVPPSDAVCSGAVCATSCVVSTVPLCANTNRPRWKGCVFASDSSPTVFLRMCAITSTAS